MWKAFQLAIVYCNEVLEQVAVLICCDAYLFSFTVF